MRGYSILPKILISACLLGDVVRYDGQAQLCKHVLIRKWSLNGQLVKHCPEVAAGLPTPRPAAEIQNGDGNDVLSGAGRVQLKDGTDISDAFTHGAASALELVQKYNIQFALLKANSPSCGNEAIYNGDFNNTLRAGAGVTAALLEANGIRVFNEQQIDALNHAIELLEQDHTK